MNEAERPTNGTQAFAEAAERFVGWLDRQVSAAGRGDYLDRLDVDPSQTFWLGRLAPEASTQASLLGDRGERLDPCAVGMRLKPPSAHGPWSFTVSVSMRAWVKDASGWRRCDEVAITTPVVTGPVAYEPAFAADGIAAAFTKTGADGLTAEVRVEIDEWDGRPELAVTLVNTSPDIKDSPLSCTHIFETSLTVHDFVGEAFILEALPDSFRYDREVPALGINAGVIAHSTGSPWTLSTSDTVIVDRGRPDYWNSPQARPDLSFTTLAADPLPSLRSLVKYLAEWNRLHWTPAALDQRARVYTWSDSMRSEAARVASEIFQEQQRLEAGLAALAHPDYPDLLRAFGLMNASIGRAAQGYDSWRPFQIGFLLGAIRCFIDPQDAEVVDTVWFATGGGKTETYLGLLITGALYDRLNGKTTGITAWSRFPLRMLSLQQTQRFADALAGAELVRREAGIAGEPLSLGFYVGAGGTPNRVPLDAKEGEPDHYDAGMPVRYQVLLRCPFCHSESIKMAFDRRTWRLTHTCGNPLCPWLDGPLPFYVVDDEIYRFLPTVVIGTLDKAALLAMQTASRGLVGPPLAMCSQPGHGYAYAPRASKLNGCLVPKCSGGKSTLPQERAYYAPRLRLQDELHLLRDSLGAVDAHYESLLDHLQAELGGEAAKIVASSATLTGYDRQVQVLYRRTARVFPQPGISNTESFWTVTTPALNRRYVAVAPRGVTLEFVSDRTVSILQESVRQLLDPTAGRLVCDGAGIDTVHLAELISQYGTTVLYGTTLYDVEGAQRSLDSNVEVAPLNSTALTGQTDFDEVRETLARLEKPERAFESRLHVIAASSMLSHGVDIERLNTMIMLGLPLTTAEFIQTTARVGRRWPGLVYVLHKIARERDAATFRQFDKFVSQGDRFVEAVPVTRRSRRVLAITLPGFVEARRLLLHEPRSAGQRLTTIGKLRDHYQVTAHDAAAESAAIVAALGLDSERDQLLIDDLNRWLRAWWRNLNDTSTSAKWPSELSPTGSPMRSLRDVEESAPIHG